MAPRPHRLGHLQDDIVLGECVSKRRGEIERKEVGDKEIIYIYIERERERERNREKQRGH